MPRENRKRGKKHKNKHAVEEGGKYEEPVHADAEAHAGPSWIVPAQQTTEYNAEAPFGYVDAEVKAYFRTVDLQIQEWQETGAERAEEDGDVDPTEDRRLFFVAALTEMSGKEKQLATDTDCSTILERMAYSMDDFVRRVFIDRLCGSFKELVKHRFASHVCQTFFTVARDTIARETRGVFPPAQDSDEGELRTLTQLILDVCEELLPTLPTLVMDSFASHVIRALLVLLVPECIPSDAGSVDSRKSDRFVRSKKSAAYKARQGTMKSVFSQQEAGHVSDIVVPKEFRGVAERFIASLRENLGDNEVRALGANQVASPVLQMLLEVEAELGMANTPGSLMDRALVGLITLCHEQPDATPEASDYLATLLRDPTASHLLEALVRRAPKEVFSKLWPTYFAGKLSKIAVHPVANYVVAKAFERVNTAQLASTVEELDAVASKIVKTSRTGVLRALVERAAALAAHEADVVRVICKGFELDESNNNQLVPCALRVKTLADYQAALASKKTEAPAPEKPWRRKGRAPADDDPLEPKTQGAVLLQAMLKLPLPHNEVVLSSIESLSMDVLLDMAHHATSSRVLDAVLDSPSVPAKTKRKFVQVFIGHYHVLADDRIGSRVADRCWAYADPYLKEKIARSLVGHEHFLAGSFYGKFFSRRLNLHLLQRSAEEWKNQQSKQPPPPQPLAQPQKGAAPKVPLEPVGSPSEKPTRLKRKAQAGDEIDALFDAALGKKVKKGRLDTEGEPVAKVPEEKHEAKAEKVGRKQRKDIEQQDKVLKDVLGAIKAAPKGEEKKGKKKKTK